MEQNNAASGTRARRVRTVSVGVGLTLLAQAAGYAQADAAGSARRDTVLENGLTVIAARNPTIPVTTIEIAFRNGAFAQVEPGEEGMPHLMEHMLFKGVGDHWTSDASGIDASYNGTTGVETVTYYLITSATKLDKGVDLIAELVRQRRFSDRDLAEEKKRVGNELERNAADPMFLLDFHADRILWGSGFRQKNVGGFLPSIRAVTADELKDHHRRFYIPNNAALIVTGDIDPADVFEAARKHLESWDRGDDPFAGFEHPPVPPLRGDTVFVVEANAPDVTLVVAWQGPSEADDPDGAVAAGLYGEIVTQRVSGAYSRLVDSGLFHYLSFSYTPSNHVGPVRLTGRTEPEKACEATIALRAEIAMMESEDYFTDDELELARTSTSVQAAFARESGIGLAHTLARSWSLGGVDRLDELTARESTLGAAEINAFVSRYIAGKPKAFLMMVSTPTIDQHTDALVAALDAWEGRR